ncbi:MAG: FecR family protein [Desulfobulbaceae bacterium]|nr:FecR family protein [Desulfobulbaceae bacterium]
MAGLLLAAILAVAVLCRAADAQPTEPQEVGSVVALRGEVSAVDGKEVKRDLTIKSPIFLGDLITTGKRARLQIMFKDNSIVSLGGNTVFKIKNYEWDPAKGKNEMKVEVKEGLFRVMGGLISKKAPEKLTTDTPVATIGIRGSMYAGSVSGQGLTVMFEGGKGINLTNGTGTVVITQPGFGSQVKDWNAPLAPPARMNPALIKNLHKDFSSLAPGRGTGVKAGKRAMPRLPVSGVKGDGRPPGKASPDQGKMTELSAQVKANPQEAANLLREAVTGGQVPVEVAVAAVLSGMQKVDRQNFDKLIREAIDMGLTAEAAKKIAEQLKASGGGCQ